MNRKGKIKKKRLNVQKCDQKYVLAEKTLDNIEEPTENRGKKVQEQKQKVKYNVVNPQREKDTRNIKDRVRHNITNLNYENNIKSLRKSGARER